jgi:hypothetical protein
MRDRLNQIKAQEGPFEVEITDQELTSYVVSLLQSGAGEFPARDMRIRFSDGYVEIWATFIDIAPTAVPVYVRGTVEVVNGDLSFVITAANAGAFPVPGAMRQSIARVFSDTLADFEFGLEFESVEIRTGIARLTGQVTGEVPDLPWGLQGTYPGLTVRIL